MARQTLPARVLPHDIDRVVAFVTAIGGLLADYFIPTSGRQHIKNPHWPPHAKFHNAQTISRIGPQQFPNATRLTSGRILEPIPVADAAARLRFSEDWTGDCSHAIGETFLLYSQGPKNTHIHVRHARFAAAAPVRAMFQAQIRATRH